MHWHIYWNPTFNLLASTLPSNLPDGHSVNRRTLCSCGPTGMLAVVVALPRGAWAMSARGRYATVGARSHSEAP
jgi:hypothetical protein